MRPSPPVVGVVRKVQGDQPRSAMIAVISAQRPGLRAVPRASTNPLVRSGPPPRAPSPGRSEELTGGPGNSAGGSPAASPPGGPGSGGGLGGLGLGAGSPAVMVVMPKSRVAGAAGARPGAGEREIRCPRPRVR